MTRRTKSFSELSKDEKAKYQNCPQYEVRKCQGKNHRGVYVATCHMILENGKRSNRKKEIWVTKFLEKRQHLILTSEGPIMIE